MPRRCHKQLAPPFGQSIEFYGSAILAGRRYCIVNHVAAAAGAPGPASAIADRHSLA
jgi:hypothetical protein